jgi:hypothetical protein
MSFLALTQEIDWLLSQEGRKQIYLDVSASMPYGKETIDFIKNKKVESFGFSDKIVSLDNRKFWFGGTSFSPVRDAVEQNPLHPDIVIVITDGYMQFTSVKHPEKWHFLIVGGEKTFSSYLPKDCHYLSLSAV